MRLLECAAVVGEKKSVGRPRYRWKNSVMACIRDTDVRWKNVIMMRIRETDK